MTPPHALDLDTDCLVLDHAIDLAIDLRTEAIDSAIDSALDQAVESLLGHRTVGEFQVGDDVKIVEGICENRIGTVHSVRPDTGIVVQIGDCFSTFAPAHIAKGALVPFDDAAERRRRQRGRVLTMAQAAELDRGTFEMYEELLGPEHPFTIGSAISLGVALHAQTYSAPSRHGPGRPQSARGAAAMSARGRVTRRREGLTLLEDTLLKARRNLGWDHPQTLEAARRMDERLREEGREDEARALRREVFGQRSLCLDRRPDSEVRFLGQGLLETLERRLGEDDRSTLIAATSLCDTLFGMEFYEEAVALSARTVDSMRRQYGDSHPDTLTALNNLACALNAVKRHGEAVDLHETIIRAMTASLGRDHPHTMVCKMNLASALHEAQRFEEALVLLREVREARLRLLGPQHPSTVAVQRSIAHTEQTKAWVSAGLKVHTRVCVGARAERPDASFFSEGKPEVADFERL